ncbi:hypothetical protein NOF55_13770 [Rhizobiaceae bacterium BDR2-2]|uniref:Uncharacterized protein n=1 Tax=Ectorhizobium quercum TaxID=2965071 RepID=A0AAE3N2N3_9HYPH|nr:hypothetical protein [Ectorhizobium quercum]MCX8998175.1 hypothetical protein [Ectorhizobium quercum]
MGLKGSAFLAIWHDIAEGAHEEYIEWHTREHMPERLSIPGFTTGKRLHAPDAGRHVFGTIYAGETLETFRSPAYLERLNTPTAWTAAVAPSFCNFLRVACERIAAAGHGDGGFMATVRLDFSGADAPAKLAEAAARLAGDILALRGVCGVHVGVARAEVSNVPTRETELRSTMSERGFDAVLLVEGSSRAGLGSALPQAEALAVATGALANPISLVYETAFSLTSEDMQAAGG